MEKKTIEPKKESVVELYMRALGNEKLSMETWDRISKVNEMVLNWMGACNNCGCVGCMCDCHQP